MADLFSYTPPARYPDVPGSKEQDKAGASHAAAEAIKPTVGEAREEILATLRRRGPLTADEIAQSVGRSPLYVRPRVSELVKLREIEKTGERRRNASGQGATVWRARAQVGEPSC